MPGNTPVITNAERNKLAGIAVGAEVNVKSDWNATSGDAQILNKPNVWHVGNFNPASYLPVGGTAANSAKLGGATKSTGSGANTIAQRNASGDINARLFRSEYDSTNSSIGFIMTQIDTANNNYIRPSTPAQFRAVVTEPYYLRSNAADTFTGMLTWHANNGVAIRLQNASYPGCYLYLGGWSRANSNNISRIRNSSANLHIDSGANGHIYLNYYSTGNVYVRGQPVWHAGNFNPASYLPVGGTAANSQLLDGVNSTQFLRSDTADTAAGRLVFTAGQPTNQSMATNNGGFGGLEVKSSGSGATAGAALLCFHRPGAYGAYLGLDTDNQLKFGGFSVGNVAHTVWHAGNFNPSAYLNQSVKTDSQPTFNTVYTNWFRALGNTGLYFQNWGGGWNMQDATWIRTYGGKRVLKFFSCQNLFPIWTF